MRESRGAVKNVDINLGKACNNRCLFCSNGNPTPEERRWGRLEDIREEITRCREDGAESIGFLGGEPTLYPHIEEIVAFSREEGYRRIYLCTNASRMADKPRLIRLLDAGVTRVAVSIHSHRAQIEDGITGRQGSFDEKVQALKNLVAARNQGRLPDGLSLNTVMHRKIVEHLEDFAGFMKDIGIADIRFNFIRPSHEAEKSKTWVPSFEQTTPGIMRLIACNQTQLDLNLNFADFPLCKLPFQVLINPELLRRYLGENWDLATDVTQIRREAAWDAPQGSIRFNWKARRQEFKTFLPACEHCVLIGQCEGVWQKYLDIYGSDEFADGPAVVEACVSAG
jgi:MoaA/NifB/PqqE/SkfB family radical SAM enzyme